MYELPIQHYWQQALRTVSENINVALSLLLAQLLGYQSFINTFKTETVLEEIKIP